VQSNNRDSEDIHHSQDYLHHAPVTTDNRPQHSLYHGGFQSSIYDAPIYAPQDLVTMREVDASAVTDNRIFIPQSVPAIGPGGPPVLPPVAPPVPPVIVTPRAQDVLERQSPTYSIPPSADRWYYREFI
jgi:hypothetical protein